MKPADYTVKEVRQCIGKIAYDETWAKRAAKFGGRKFRPYKCGRCPFWHLTKWARYSKGDK